MAQILYERGVLEPGMRGVGFGVGEERLPALFAKHKVRVTATDQAFTKKKAGHWSEQELARGTQSLNRLGICDPKVFAEHVEYMTVDMNKVPRSLSGKYDFLWSNCALGHLGSIPAGLEFIEKSLDCLKPGGWAIHTTELNILSNSRTVDGGSTVIFRLKDIYGLQTKLNRQGFIVSPFKLVLANTDKDKRISMRPQFGNDYSKIQVMGHLATQIVLIIHKPKNPVTKAGILRRQIALRAAYMRNLATVRKYIKTDPSIKEIFASQKIEVNHLKLVPQWQRKTVTLSINKPKEITIKYKNNSKGPLFSAYGRLADIHPIVLATNGPKDRKSVFVDDSWLSKPNANRLSGDIWVETKAGEHEVANYIKPGEDLVFKFILNAKEVPRGNYEEEFSVVQEGAGWVEGSSFKLNIKVT
jgi:hypothetical protein